MKRSEMVDKIRMKLHWMNTLFATAVLDVIEEGGMLPPLNEDWMSLDECREFYGKNFDPNDGLPRKNIHRWEPEDERAE